MSEQNVVYNSFIKLIVYLNQSLGGRGGILGGQDFEIQDFE